MKVLGDKNIIQPTAPGGVGDGPTVDIHPRFASSAQSSGSEQDSVSTRTGVASGCTAYSRLNVGKFLKLFVPRFPHQRNGDSNIPAS